MNMLAILAPILGAIALLFAAALSFEGSCRLMNCLERRNGKGSE